MFFLFYDFEKEINEVFFLVVCENLKIFEYSIYLYDLLLLISKLMLLMNLEYFFDRMLKYKKKIVFK